jgi:hypothetical protein
MHIDWSLGLMVILFAPAAAIADQLRDITVSRANLCVTEGSVEDSSEHRSTSQ